MNIFSKILLPELLVLIVIITTSCATVPPRLQESGLNSGTSFENKMPFDVYVRQMTAIIEKARVDINEINREAILKANSPFELKPDESAFPKTKAGKYKRAILLIHGLNDSPYLIQPIAKHLQSRGFLVRAILLPGHGTVPGDLIKVSHEDWIRATEYGIGTLKADAEQVYIGGFSTGGALSLLKGLQDREIKGLLLFAPAVGVREKLVALSGFINAFTDWFGPARDDTDYAKYESFSMNATYQIYKLTVKIDNELSAGRRLNMPVFTAASEDDWTVDTAKTLEVLTKYATSKLNRIIYYSKNPCRNQELPAGKMNCENSYIPSDRVLDFSHISITIPPDDPHYGRNGGYRYCLHYPDNQDKKRSCLHDSEVWKGEITPENLKTKTIRRLTYNPLYQSMIGQLDRFLKDIETGKESMP